MAMALVFFLLCAMVGTVVLSAASVAAGTVSRERALSQRTMSLTSAAELLAKEIPAMTMAQDCIMTETVTTTVTTQDDGNPATQVNSNTSFTSGQPKLNGPEFLQGIAISVQEPANQTSPELTAKPSETPLDIIITGPSEGAFAKKIPEVTGTLSFAKDFTLTVQLACGSDNAVTMVFPAHTQMESQVSVATQNGENQSVKTTTTTYTFTVTWEAPEITEGASITEGGTAS